ncbi:MAG: TetR/AcrR family transcriptional regulator, partial [Campylobacterota bacterium]|nr:TetR/AcrR family transcriptional regulator [Campylobacterota bacterium]
MGKKITQKINKLKKTFYIEASSKYFEEYGYEKAKMTDLAKELEISVGTLYKVFDSKENLYFEYILSQINQLVRILNNEKSSDPMENLKMYLSRKYRPFIEKRKSIEYTLNNDPFFFHKLNLARDNPMNEIYKFLADQFAVILKEQDIDYNHIA